MINTLTRKELGVAVACALALGILSGTAEGQAQDEHSIVTRSDGTPVMSGFGRHVSIEVFGTRLVK